MFRPDERAVTPVISTVLLVVVAVVLVGLVGNAIVTGITPDADPATRSDISIELTDSDVTVSHLGGESIPLADLRVVVRNASTTRQYDPTTANLSDSTDDHFDPGETWSRSHPLNITGDETLEVILVHEPSQSVLARKTVTRAAL